MNWYPPTNNANCQLTLIPTAMDGPLKPHQSQMAVGTVGPGIRWWGNAENNTKKGADDV